MIYLAGILAAPSGPSVVSRSVCQTCAADSLLFALKVPPLAISFVEIRVVQLALVLVIPLLCLKGFASLSKLDRGACRSYTS